MDGEGLERGDRREAVIRSNPNHSLDQRAVH